MTREAMQMALDALVENDNYLGSLDFSKEIAALRQALANEALDRKAENARELGLDYEPIAQRWAVFCSGCGKEWSVSYEHPGKSICADCEGMSRNLEQPVTQAEYERGFIDGMQKQMQSSVDKAVNSMSRQWVGLTFEEQTECLGAGVDNGWKGVMNATEAKLKEKNQ